jgi:hypothetical protein
VKGQQVDEMKGADPSALEAKVNQHKVEAVDSFGGKMVTLGGDSNSGPAVDPREARLRFMGLSVEAKPVEKVSSQDSLAASGQRSFTLFHAAPVCCNCFHNVFIRYS